MRKIHCVLETGFVGTKREGVIEVEDDATEEDIEAAVQEWALNFVSWGWSE